MHSPWREEGVHVRDHLQASFLNQKPTSTRHHREGQNREREEQRRTNPLREEDAPT
jgi:hypothetical protein